MTFIETKTTKGFSLVEVLIIMAIAGAGLYITTSLMQSNTRSIVESSTRNSSDTVSKNITALLNNPNAWNFTVADVTNTSLDCIRNGTPCAAGGGGLFRIRSGSDVVYYDPVTSASAGFSPDGTPCNTFDPANGNDACPMRLDLRWTPNCPAAGPCINPPVQIQARMLYRNRTPSRTLAWNEVQSGINMTMNAAGPPIAYAMAWGPNVCPASGPSDSYCPAGMIAKTGGWRHNWWNGSGFQSASMANYPLYNPAGVPIGWRNQVGGYACDNWAQVWVLCATR